MGTINEDVLELQRLAGDEDLSEQYISIFNASNEAALRTEAKELADLYEIVVVKGFQSSALPRYMADIIDELKQADFTIRLAEDFGLNSQSTVEQGRPFLINAILTGAHPDKKVLMVTHSMGGLRTMDVLIHDAAVSEKVAGWISIQGAIKGSPVADRLHSLPVRIKKIWLEVAMQGDIGSIADLTIEASDSYFEKNATNIKNLPSSHTIVSYASGSKDTPLNIVYHAAIGRWWGRAKNDPANDGLVPMAHGYIPGTWTVFDGYENAPDHAGPSIAYFPDGKPKYNSRKLILTLLSLWKAKAKHRILPAQSGQHQS